MQDNKRKAILEFLKNENDYITYLLEAFEVPETIEDESDDEVIMDVPRKKQKLATKDESAESETVEEEADRATVMKRKIDQRKATKNSTRSDRKKLKQEKLLKKKQIINRRKAMTNEILKQERDTKKVQIKKDPDSNGKPSGVFNSEGKMFFSKVQIEGEKAKKVYDTNPRANLQKLKSQKQKIQEYVESGDKMKAKEEKEKLLWKAAFDKTQGVKVKDNVEILKKTIKKRKGEKKKSKEKWSKIKQKVEEKSSQKQKKREDNLNKRKTDKLKTKKKLAIKKGRLIKPN